MSCHLKLISNDFEAFLDIPRLVPAKKVATPWRAQVPNPALRWADWSLPRRHPWHWDMVGVAHGISRALPGPSLQFQPSKLFHQIPNNTQAAANAQTFLQVFWSIRKDPEWHEWHQKKTILSILSSYCPLESLDPPEIAIIEEILRPKVVAESPLSWHFDKFLAPSLLQLVPDLSLAAKNKILWMTAVVMRPCISPRPSLGHIALPRVLWP